MSYISLKKREAPLGVEGQESDETKGEIPMRAELKTSYNDIT